MTMKAAITDRVGTFQKMLPKPMLLTSTVGTSRRSTPLVMTSARPSAMPSVPSVTISGGTLARAISTPLSRPQASPATIATTSPTNADPQPCP